MKKILLTLAAALFSAMTLFGQLATTSPMTHAANGGYTWGGTFQLGAEVHFAGTITDVTLDSVLCKIYYGNGNWEPTAEFSVVENVQIVDGAFDTVLIIPADWRTQAWEDTTGSMGDNLIRPMMQVQGWSADTVYAFQLRTMSVVEPWADSVAFDNTDLVNGTFIGEVTPDTVLNLGGATYGINDYGYCETRLSWRDPSWAVLDGHEYIGYPHSSVDPNGSEDSTGGFIQSVQITVPADFPTLTEADITAGNFTNIRFGSVSPSWVWTPFIFLNVNVVATLTDSIELATSVETIIEVIDAGTPAVAGTTVDFAGTAYPAGAMQVFRYELSDSTLGAIDSATGVFTPGTVVLEVGETDTVEVIVTHVTTGLYQTVPVVFTNEFSSVEEAVASNVKVFPNPATSELNITGVESANIAIFNLLGAEVMNTQLEGSVVNVSELPAGTYILNIQSNDETIVRKISIR